MPEGTEEIDEISGSGARGAYSIYVLGWRIAKQQAGIKYSYLFLAGSLLGFTSVHKEAVLLNDQQLIQDHMVQDSLYDVSAKCYPKDNIMINDDYENLKCQCSLML